MDGTGAIQRVYAFLHDRLQATGESGFEGLVRVLLQEATGQEFRLSSSGRQSGRDAASEAGPANAIKIETKHYRETTALNPRELEAELHEAADSDPGLDVWALAASRSVSEQIARSLERQAESLGVDAVILDLGGTGLPRLAVLMAAFPAIIRAWASRHQLNYDAGELEPALCSIAQQPDFESAKSRLFAKLNSMIGYDAARRRIHNRLLTVLSSSRDALARFHQPLSIREPSAHLVHRAQISRALDTWWDISGTPRLAVAVGEEGTGKTWAVFDWALERLERGGMPIVLPFAAVAEQVSKGDSIEGILPRLMAKWTGVLDERRWQRRLSRWSSADATGCPLILLIIDGLNERADLDWPALLAGLLTEPWRGNVAVLATDRPHHWRTRCTRAGLSEFDEISIGGYSQTELNQALSASGLSHKDIPDGLLQLVSIPRYCGLVARHYSEMIAAGDFTRERLIYIEGKERHSSRLGYPLTDQQFFGIIRDLAGHARHNSELNPKDLRQLISIPGGDEVNVYEELVSSGLLVPVPGIGGTERFVVEPLRLVYGFGMLLAAELAKGFAANKNEIEEFLISWFEPQPGMDRKVDICASAMFHALFHPSFPESALRELIRYWLSLRNWAESAHWAFAAYVVRCPTIFVEIAEDFWSSTRDNGGAHEFLGAALAAHRDDPRLQPVLVEAIERWMGFIHPLGRRYWTFDAERTERSRKAVEKMTGSPPLQVVEEAGKADRVRQEIEARAGCAVLPGEIEVAGYKLTVVSDGALLRLARFGLMLMSTGDPSPFVGSLAHWAVASAVMDDSDFSELAAWVIRLSERDVDSILLEQARGLLSRGEPTASDAARILLWTIGSRESHSLIDEHDLTPGWYKERRAEHVNNPCSSLYEWTDDECLECLGREDVPLHIILTRAGVPIVDPTITVPSSLVERARAALKTVDPGRIRAASSYTLEMHHAEMLRPILCARAPSDIANLMRDVVRTMPDRNSSGQYYLAIQLPEISLLLRDDELIAVSRATVSLSAGASEWSLELQNGVREAQQVAEARAFSAIAPHLAPAELVKRLVARPKNALDLVGLELWFGPVSEETGHAVTSLLHAPADEAMLRRVLWVLPHLGISLSETDCDRLVELASSKDAEVRSGAFRVAVVSGDEQLGRRMIDRGVAATPGMNPFEEWWVTSLLTRFGGQLAFDDLAKRLRPSAIGFAIQERGNRKDELELYARCLDQEWQRIVSAEDPELERLPEIEIGKSPGDIGVVPELYEPRGTETIRLDRSRSWTSGPPGDPGLELQKVFSPEYYEEQVRQLNVDRRRKTEAILAAWRTDAFQWYGRTFSVHVMDLLYERAGALVDRWVAPALSESPVGAAIRVRTGGLLEAVCRVLLNRNPESGFRLWRLLHKRDDSPLVFDTLDLAFGADSSEAKLARKIVLDESWSDSALAQLVFTCTRLKRDDWLEEIIQELISGNRLWEMAKGLTLASFSDMTRARFEEIVSRAAIQYTWVEQSLRPLRENVRRNHVARYWYRVFLTTGDDDAAWGALQIVLAHADERFLDWRGSIESEYSGIETTKRRLQFLQLGWHTRRALRQEIDRDKERRERLFGIKIQPGEIEPFMRSGC